MADEQSGNPENSETDNAATQGQLTAEHERARTAEEPLETQNQADQANTEVNEAFSGAVEGTEAPVEAAEPTGTIAAPTTNQPRTNKNGFNRSAQGQKMWFGAPGMEAGDAFGQLIMLISMLFDERGRELFPDMVDMLYPKKTYTDPVERAARIDRLREVVHNPNHPDRQQTATEFITEHFPHIASGEGTLLRPDLLERLQGTGTSELKHHVNLTIEAVNKYNEGLGPDDVHLDANLVLNQIFQESRFRADAVGPQTKYGQAMGIAQFLPSTGKEYGLETHADLMNPEKALPAAVEHIGDLTQEYKNQTLAMVAYNGGKGAVKWVAEELEKPISEVTINDWMGYTDYLNKEYGEGASNLWRNQTNGYVALSHSDYWDDEQKIEAQKLMKELGLPVPEEQTSDTTEQPSQGPAPFNPVG